MNPTHMVLAIKKKGIKNSFACSLLRLPYFLHKSGVSVFVELKIYNMLGREIQTVVNELQQAGSYSYYFDASNLSNGVYFYQLKMGNRFSETKKMLYIK